MIELNRWLIKKQGLSHEEVEQIMALHKFRDWIEEQIYNNTYNKGFWLDQWTDVQFELQKQWRFEEDARFHKFWDMKGCTCPKMDNDDAYPTGYYTTSQDCKIHGG